MQFVPLALLFSYFLISTFLWRFGNYLKNIVMGFVVFFLVSIFMSYIYLASNTTINVLAVHAVLLAIGLILTRFKSNENNRDVFILDYVIIFVVVFGLLGIMLYKGRNGIRLPILSHWDGAAHFSMMKEAYKTRSLLYSDKNPLPAYYNTISNPKDYQGIFYPPGFYITGAILLLSLPLNVGIDKLNVIFIDFYYVYQFIIIGLSLYVTYMHLGLLSNGRLNRLVGLAFLTCTHFGVFYFSNVILGFAPFIFCLFAYGMFLYGLSMYSREKSSYSIILMMSALILVANSWFLITPPLILISAFIFFRRGIRPREAILLFSAVVISSIPILLQLGDIINHRYLNSAINAQGGVQQFSILFYLLFAAVFVFLCINRPIKDRMKDEAILAAIFAVYLFIIAIYQLITAGGLGYYFQKILFVLIFTLSYFMYAIIQNQYVLIDGIKQDQKEHVYINKVIIILFIVTFALTALPETYLTIKPALTKEEQNSLLIINQIYDFHNTDITVFPNEDALILWNGAINEHNSSFYKKAENWSIDEKKLDGVKKWVLNDNSNKQHLILDQKCWFSESLRKQLQNYSKNRLLWYRPRCAS